MRIVTGSDHAGIELRTAIVAHLRRLGHEVDDLGTHERTSTDYPDWARAVAGRVVEGAAERGILICGTGQGMAMAANKVPGVRAAVVADTFSAKMAIAHNDARVLCIGQRVVGAGLALEIVEAWLGARFEAGRHQTRLDKLEA